MSEVVFRLMRKPVRWRRLYFFNRPLGLPYGGPVRNRERDPPNASLTRPRNRFPEVLPFLETLDGVI